MVLRAEDRRYLGTCFPFRWRNKFLTAAHCLGTFTPSELIVHSQGGPDFQVTEIHRHLEADIAALITDEKARGIPYPFTGLHVFEGTYGVGSDIAAFGFPVGGSKEEPPDQPTPRVFRGFVQRLADFKGAGKVRYRHYELSFPAPLGLSGGPVFVPGSDRVFAMVVGNIESYTTLVEESKVVAEGHTHSVEGRQIISYGMALSLWHVEEWLKVVTPLSGHAVW